jgi:hypothetical protein
MRGGWTPESFLGLDPRLVPHMGRCVRDAGSRNTPPIPKPAESIRPVSSSGAGSPARAALPRCRARTGGWATVSSVLLCHPQTGGRRLDPALGLQELGVAPGAPPSSPLLDG